MARTTQNNLLFRATQGDYWFDFRNFSGEASGANPVTATVSTIPVLDFPALPGRITDTLETQTEVHLYRLPVLQGANLDLRIHAPTFLAVMELLDEDLQLITRTYSERLQWIAPSDGEIFVRISPYSGQADADAEYTLGIQELVAMPIGAIPATTNGVLDDLPFPQWYRATVQALSLIHI